jgi:hypothetical protein
MAEWQLVSLWKTEAGGSLSDIRMSTDGQYLLTRGDGRIAYYNWGPQLLWQGRAQSTLSHVAVGSNRDQILAASDDMIYSFSHDGTLLWDGSTKWKVEALYLNATADCIAASNGTRVGCLSEQGKPIWQHDLRKTVRSIAISPDGQWVLAGGEDSRVTCLDRQGHVVWTSQFDKQIVSIAAGESMVTVGDAGQAVHCLDSDGYELCQREMSGQIKSVAASATGKHIAVGTEGELHQFLFTDAPVLFMPVRPKHTGAQNALQQLGTDNVQNVFMNHDGGCLLVEGKQDRRCYDLEGNLLWSCPKIDVKTLRQEEERRRREEASRRQEEERHRAQEQRQQEKEHRPSIIVEAQRAGEELLRKQEERRQIQAFVRQTRHAFTEYVYSQSRKRARKAQARQNIRIKGEILDLFFDGKGYLFVTTARLDTIQRAAKLAKRTSIYIITHDASNNVVQMVKRTRAVNLYRLSDMTKTTGQGEGSDFETFMQLQGNKFTPK